MNSVFFEMKVDDKVQMKRRLLKYADKLTKRDNQNVSFDADNAKNMQKYHLIVSSVK